MARVAVVTGASRGVGVATASVLAKQGCWVVVNDRTSSPQADEVVATITAARGKAVAIKADVTECSRFVTISRSQDDATGGRTRANDSNFAKKRCNFQKAQAREVLYLCQQRIKRSLSLR